MPSNMKEYYWEEFEVQFNAFSLFENVELLIIIIKIMHYYKLFFFFLLFCCRKNINGILLC